MPVMEPLFPAAVYIEINNMNNEIINFRKINEVLYTGGQPSAEQIRQLQSSGVINIINIAPYDSRYSIEDEQSTVESLGMNYHFIPVDFKAPAPNDYYRVHDLLLSLKDEKTFLHCAANYRATVFAGHYAMTELGWSPSERDELIAGVWNMNEFPVWQNFNEQLESEMKNNQKCISDITDVFASYLLTTPEDAFEDEGRAALERKLARFINTSRPIEIILPGFPCKSPNVGSKCFGSQPDFGDVMALKRLDSLGQKINALYAGGCVLTVLSDGRTFNDILGIPDADRRDYNERLRSLITSHILRWESLSSFFPDATSDAAIRQQLVESAQLPSTDEQTPEEAAAYDKLFAFLRDDLAFLRTPAQSDEEYRNLIAEKTRAMTLRGKALNALIERAFPEAIRLSVHQYSNSGPKYTFAFAEGLQQVIQPWHAVPVLSLDGTLSLLRKSRVDSARHVLIQHDGKPWLYAEIDNPAVQTFHFNLIKQPSFGLVISKPRGMGIGALSPEFLATLSRQFGFVCIKQANFASQDDLTDFCRPYGEIYEWSFGPVHVVKPADTPKGFVHSLEKTPIHWDLSMLPLHHEKVKEDEWFTTHRFMLYCHTPPARGEGQTTVVDCRIALDLVGPEVTRQWASTQITYNTEKTYFGGHPRTYPLVYRHPETNEQVLRYQEGSESALQKFMVSVDGMEPAESDALIESVNDLVYRPECMIVHDWEAGDLLVIDNWITLHGRLPMSEASRNRELWRVQTY